MATLLSLRASRILTPRIATCTFTTPIYSTEAFHTSANSLNQLQPRISTNSWSVCSRSISNRRGTLKVGLRHNSSANANTDTIPEHILTWDRFFDLRKKRRWINFGCSIVTAFVAVSAITPVLVQQDFDSWATQTFGIDPYFVMGIATFGVAAGGWLCGPSFGSSMFSVWAARRGWNKLIAEKERSFYGRIKQYRADPSASSPQNPIPDYYGEKVASVKDYRRWLKDQKAFNLKKNKNMI